MMRAIIMIKIKVPIVLTWNEARPIKITKILILDHLMKLSFPFMGSLQYSILILTMIFKEVLLTARMIYALIPLIIELRKEYIV